MGCAHSKDTVDAERRDGAPADELGAVAAQRRAGDAPETRSVRTRRPREQAPADPVAVMTVTMATPRDSFASNPPVTAKAKKKKVVKKHRVRKPEKAAEPDVSLSEELAGGDANPAPNPLLLDDVPMTETEGQSTVTGVPPDLVSLDLGLELPEFAGGAAPTSLSSLGGAVQDTLHAPPRGDRPADDRPADRLNTSLDTLSWDSSTSAARGEEPPE